MVFYYIWVILERTAFYFEGDIFFFSHLEVVFIFDRYGDSRFVVDKFVCMHWSQVADTDRTKRQKLKRSSVVGEGMGHKSGSYYLHLSLPGLRVGFLLASLREIVSTSVSSERAFSATGITIIKWA